jgi:hypothetical protein
LAKNGGKLKPRLVGINKASTFTGFCSKHDTAIFASLEAEPFAATPEQCFLLGYRAFCREFFIKKSLSSLREHSRLQDCGKPVHRQAAIQNFNAAFELGRSLAIQDLVSRKSVFDRYLVNRTFHNVRAYVIEFSHVPPVMCSGAFYPVEDFGGNNLQDLTDLSRSAHLMTVTSFRGGSNGLVVLSWLQEDDPVCLRFVQSLRAIPDSRITDALLRLFFQHVENIYMKPQWWETLSDATREKCMSSFQGAAEPMESYPAGYLRDDGCSVDVWTVVRRHALGFQL